MKRFALCLCLVSLLGCKKKQVPRTIGLALDVGGRGDQSFNDGALRGLEIMAAGQRYTTHGYEPLSDAAVAAAPPPPPGRSRSATRRWPPRCPPTCANGPSPSFPSRPLWCSPARRRRTTSP